MQIKVFYALFLAFLTISSFSQAMERGLGTRYILSSEVALTPEQKRLRESITTVLNESEDIYDVVARLKALAQQNDLYRAALANDLYILQIKSPVAWLVQQGSEYLYKYYFIAHRLHDKKFIAMVDLYAPDLAYAKKKIDEYINLSNVDFAATGALLKDLAGLKRFSQILNSEAATEYIINSYKLKYPLPKIEFRFAANLGTPGAVQYLKKHNFGWKDLIPDSYWGFGEIVKKQPRTIIFWLENLPDVHDAESQAIATKLLDAAVRNRNKEILSLLLKKKADPNSTIVDEFMSPHTGNYTFPYKAGTYNTLLIIAINQENPDLDLIRILLDNGALPNLSNFIKTQHIRAETPLLAALRLYKEDEDKSLLEVIKLLLNAGADANQPNENGELPIVAAAGGGYYDLVDQMITAKADINKQDKSGHTALMEAANNKKLPILKRLIEAKADLNVKDLAGNTALMHAIKAKNFDGVKMLLAAGADPNIENNQGQTALLLAKDNEEMFKYILEFKRLARIQKTKKPENP